MRSKFVKTKDHTLSSKVFSAIAVSFNKKVSKKIKGFAFSLTEKKRVCFLKTLVRKLERNRKIWKGDVGLYGFRMPRGFLLMWCTTWLVWDLLSTKKK